MKKLFISQPMNGLSDQEILKAREEAIKAAEKEIGEKVEVLPSFFQDFKPEGNIPLAYLGKSISMLAEADIAYFGKGWQDARGCKIEHECALQYGIKIILSEFDPHKTAIGKRIDAGLWD